MKSSSTHLRQLPMLLAWVVCSGAAAAADEASMFALSGFATLGVVKTSTNEAEYVTSGPRGATRHASGEVDSKLGAQIDARLSPVFSATLQVLSKETGQGNFDPAVEWAFVKAQVLPSLALRIGRIGAPLFAVSDFRNVGYANTWVRPPVDVYNQVPVSSIDGVDAIYQLGTSLGTLSTQVFFGTNKGNLNRTDLDYKDAAGFNVTLEADNGLTLRLGHVRGKLTFKSAALASLVSILRSTPFATVGNEMDVTNKQASFSGIGAVWDSGAWLLNAEYTRRRTASLISDTNGWYVTAGRRFGPWTPYVGASGLHFVDSNVNNNVQPLNPALAQLKATVDLVLANAQQDQKTVMAGARWDFRRNFALKAQIDRIKPNGVGTFRQASPGFGTQGKSVNVYSVCVDTVF